jgi:hypothetical protein
MLRNLHCGRLHAIIIDNWQKRCGSMKISRPKQSFTHGPNHCVELPAMLCGQVWIKLHLSDHVLDQSRWRGLNSTNVLDEGLRIGKTGHRMNSKVNSVKQGGYESKHACRTWLAFNLSHTVPSWPLYIGGQVSRIGWDPIQITISIYNMNLYFY